MEKQDKSANRAEDHPTIPQTDKHKGRRSGKVKKAGKRSKKGVQDLAEGALAEYSQLMDALGSKVSDGSEVTAAEEEDVCGPFLDQLLENTTEAGFDMDYISSLLSSDDSQDTLSSMIPEPVAGCSDWTRTAVSGAPSAVQHDFSSSEATNHTMENVLVPFRDNINGQNVFRTSTQPLLANPAAQSSQTDPNASVQETAHPDLQDFGLEADGNQKDEALYVSELDCAPQSNGLQNYNSHHATFPRAIKHDPEAPKPPVDDRVEHRGEKNMEVGQKTQKYIAQQN
ncbi:uncharacterized protein LOC107720482 [Sinocyclocheilus rhinocerous]|uniref:uncharacterized protein LOC107720482 n=1 Tax=Sinocyclocheilus rhinocerous TaxID=307959 RepID=UPI0007BA4C19|nr:PREDICTED: uncharacterized protein LOC107720482 [Sinocyclocheilus rhinocerous]